MRILLIEDEDHLARLVAEVLGGEGHAVETVGDGRSGLSRALAEPYDLLVVDWMLPGLDGVQVVRMLRMAEVRTPILMLTARDQVEDRVEGLDAGADDYLPKPFAFPELLARVRALARRPPEKDDEGTTLGAGDVTIDPSRHEVRRGGESIELTAKEFALLPPSYSAPGRSSRARSSSTRSGRVPAGSAPTWWTSTSTTCAGSSTVRRSPPAYAP